MRVLGAKFTTLPDALDALERVRAEFGQDVRVAPLADPDANSTLLAGTFEDVDRDEVKSVLQGFGGEIVSDVDEELLG